MLLIIIDIINAIFGALLHSDLIFNYFTSFGEKLVYLLCVTESQLTSTLCPKDSALSTTFLTGRLNSVGNPPVLLCCFGHFPLPSEGLRCGAWCPALSAP